MNDTEMLKLVEKLKRLTTNPDVLTVLLWAEKTLANVAANSHANNANVDIEDCDGDLAEIEAISAAQDRAKKMKKTDRKTYMRKRRADKKTKTGHHGTA